MSGNAVPFSVNDRVSYSTGKGQTGVIRSINEADHTALVYFGVGDMGEITNEVHFEDLVPAAPLTESTI